MVTGANGFLGHHLCECLLEDGYNVLAMVRDPGKFKLTHANLKIITSWADVLACCDAVIHCAALTTQHLYQLSKYREVNVMLSLSLMQQCAQAGVRRFIYVSTANTIGHGTPENPGNETQPMCKPFSQLAYAKSKAEAEQLLFAQDTKMEVICVNPGFMLGPRVTTNGSGKLIKAALGKKIVMYPQGSKSVVDVRDVGKAIVNTLHYGKHGQRYLLTGPTYSYKELYTSIQKIARHKALLIPVPRWLLMCIGAWGTCKHLIGLNSLLSLPNMRALCTQVHYDNRLAQEVLNLQLRPIHDTLQQAVQTLKTT